MNPSLRIGYLSTLYHTSHLLRKLRWIEEDLGLSCRWSLFGTGPEMVEAFGRGEIDLGYIGLPPALIGAVRGVPLVCVGGGHVEGTVMVAGPAFRDLSEAGGTRAFLEQFRGRRVGVPGTGSIHDVIFRALLLEHAIEDVDVVHASWADLLPYALRKGQVDAAVGTPPLALLCERECGTRIVLPPASLWPFNPSYGIVVRREMLDRPDWIEGFLRLHEKACNLVRESPERAARYTTEAMPGLDARFVRDVYAVSPKYCASLPDPYVASTMRFVPVMERLGLLERPLAAAEIFVRAFVERVHPAAHHYSSR